MADQSVIEFYEKEIIAVEKRIEHAKARVEYEENQKKLLLEKKAACEIKPMPSEQPKDI